MNTQNWEEQFDEFYTLPEMMIPGPQRERAIKTFIANILTQQRQEIAKEVEDLEAKHQNCGCCSPALWSEVKSKILNAKEKV